MEAQTVAEEKFNIFASGFMYLLISFGEQKLMGRKRIVKISNQMILTTEVEVILKAFFLE